MFLWLYGDFNQEINLFYFSFWKAKYRRKFWEHYTKMESIAIVNANVIFMCEGRMRKGPLIKIVNLQL